VLDPELEMRHSPFATHDPCDPSKNGDPFDPLTHFHLWHDH